MAHAGQNKWFWRFFPIQILNTFVPPPDLEIYRAVFDDRPRILISVKNNDVRFLIVFLAGSYESGGPNLGIFPYKWARKKTAGETIFHYINIFWRAICQNVAYE